MSVTELVPGQVEISESDKSNVVIFNEQIAEKLNSLSDDELARAILLFTEVMDSAIIKPRPFVNRGVGTNQ